MEVSGNKTRMDAVGRGGHVTRDMTPFLKGGVSRHATCLIRVTCHMPAKTGP